MRGSIGLFLVTLTMCDTVLDSRSSEESVRKPAASTEDEKVVDVVSLRNAEGGYKLAFPHINERKLLWKMDLRVVSLIFIMNFFTFLDR